MDRKTLTVLRERHQSIGLGIFKIASLVLRTCGKNHGSALEAKNFNDGKTEHIRRYEEQAFKLKQND